MHTHTCTNIYIYIYIYIYTHIHTHTHTNIYNMIINKYILVFILSSTDRLFRSIRTLQCG